MTCEQVNVEFAGLVHDHLMAANKIQSSQANLLHHHHPPSLNGNYQHSNQHNIPPNSENNHQNHHLQSLDGCLNSAPSVTNKSQQAHEQRQQQKREVAVDADADRSALKSAVDQVGDNDAATQSTIAILRRHPMYDSLVLVKKYRPCLDGYILEFPTSFADSAPTRKLSEQNTTPTGKTATENDAILGKAYDVGGGRTKLVSVYLDGDDPIYQHKLKQQNGATNGGDQQESGEVVYVPINGLLTRLNNYDQHGISIDSRVYAFAMGLKTAERFLTSSTEKEVQEAPPL